MITKAAMESPMRFSVTRTAKICAIEIAASISLAARCHAFSSDHNPHIYGFVFPAFSTSTGREDRWVSVGLAFVKRPLSGCFGERIAK